MNVHAKYFPLLFCVVALLSVPTFAQTSERRQAGSTTDSQEKSATLPPDANSLEVVANEIGQLRKSVQTLNARLRELSDKGGANDANQGSANDRQKSIAASLTLLASAEQRAEIMRKQLLDLIEKETALKVRQVQIEEDMRPESIERALNPIGSTRTVELRDTRRRVLETERRGVESLLNQTVQGRIRLDEDLRQADAMVGRLRQRVLPLIDKEIEKIAPN
jgi:septal ring factor EnvC (AmiA/AmiB activator)